MRFNKHLSQKLHEDELSILSKLAKTLLGELGLGSLYGAPAWGWTPPSNDGPPSWDWPHGHKPGGDYGHKPGGGWDGPKGDHGGGGHCPPDPCEPHYEVNPYEALKYVEARSADGVGNNVANPEWGSTEHAFVRIADNSYGDGLGTLPDSLVAPTTLPTPRAVSDNIMAQPKDGGGNDIDIPNEAGSNEYLQFFGQFLTHDIVETNPFGSETIFGMAGLPFPFTRSAFETTPDGVHQQLNEETSFLDLSQVYGNNETALDYLRADLPDGTQSAKLLVGATGLLPTFNEVAANTFDPTDTGTDVLDAMIPAGTPGRPNEDEYAAGDNRVNQQLPLATHHTTWVLEHNYQVDKLASMFPTWTQDELFNAARAIVEAEWQHVVYDEYLPALLGEGAISEYTGYDPTVDPSIINEFTTAAFRFGHDQSRNFLQFLAEDGTETDVQTLAQLFGFDVATTTGDDIDAMIRGQLSQFTQEIDGFVVEGNRNFLFNIGGGAVTTDLETFDVARGRDHGISDFNAVREAIGLDPYADFDDFGAKNGIDTDRLNTLKALYNDDISLLDTVVGGLLEQHVDGSQLGETFHILTVIQFEALRDGDRFWYENLFKDNPELIKEIESSSLAEIIGRNSNIGHLYHDAFAAHERIGGTDGNDYLHGTEGKDLLIGFEGRDKLFGYAGNDDLFGDEGRDKLSGGWGDDILNGGADRDVMCGGAGSDIFVLEHGTGKDKILDFDVKQDKLDLSDFGFQCIDDVLDAVVSSKGCKTVIQLSDYGDQVQLVGVHAWQLNADNVILDEGYHDSQIVA